MNIVVTALEGVPAPAQPVEVVERKGLGHPDTMCDALAEEVSLALSRFYLERFGFVLHHNVDKVMLRGGVAQAAFGGGRVIEPMELFLAGRATQEYGGIRVPVEDLAIGSARSWLASHLHALDCEHDVRVHCLIRPGSSDLVELFERQRRGALRLANDTSIGVGFAPLTPLEGAVLAADRGLKGRSAPERGEDIKVMGVRVGDRSTLTISCAFVDRHLVDLDAYLAARLRAAESARAAAAAALGADLTVGINAADDPSVQSVFLTVTGTSAEGGDDGQTGRGNRGNGLIAPARPTAIESIAGKNPMTHGGKLYNVAAMRVAEALVSEIEAVREAQVLLVSRIGMPIDEPQIAHLRLSAKTPERVAGLAPRAREILRRHLAELGSLWKHLLTLNLVTGEATPS